MKRIKFLALSTIATAMIFGSSLVLASQPAGDAAGTAADAPVVTTEAGVDLQAADPRPVKRSGGGAGHALKK